MIVLGGVTRLTGSGLSIMEWAPFAGTLPPMSDAEWQRLYHLYQQIPQYALVNQGFGLAGFKQIFWLEWIHRLWGRLIGFAFLVPLIWFWASGRIERGLRPMMVGLFPAWRPAGSGRMVHGGIRLLPGYPPPFRLIGWSSTWRSHCCSMPPCVWTGLSVLWPVPPRPAASRLLHRLGWLGCGCYRGDHAGRWLRRRHSRGLRLQHVSPDGGAPGARGLCRSDPFVRNLTENIAAVQFDHRLLASLPC